MKEILLPLSVIISFIGYFIGIRSILKGSFKPQRMTRLIILMVISISALSLFISGDRVGFFLAFAQFTACIIIFLLSIKYGVGGKNTLDIFILVFVVIILMAWKVTDNPLVALYLSIIADFTGLIPTLIKSYKQPFTEDPVFYLADFVAGLLNLMALSLFEFKDVAFPGYIFIINGLLMGIIIFRRRQSLKYESINHAS